ncbi:MAG TPA: DUF5671 domain-containing protein [Candidatus Limnocylindria bacterium]|nr:DUF5671 domain-containing protein [Candidatus Limnocylindria bacterium]
MIFGVLIPLGVLALVVGVIVALVRSREALDLSPRGLVRGYLYLASFAGVLTIAIGVGSLVNWGLATAVGPGLIYGESPKPAVVRACPPSEPNCGPTPAQLEQQRRFEQQNRERQRSEDLLRGLTYTAFGAAFWAAHWAARRTFVDEGRSPLRRGYLMLGTVVFGLATIVLVPTGLYQLLSYLVLPVNEGQYRGGADAVGGAVAVLPVWLLYLRTVVRELRAA